MTGNSFGRQGGRVKPPRDADADGNRTAGPDLPLEEPGRLALARRKLYRGVAVLLGALGLAGTGCVEHRPTVMIDVPQDSLEYGPPPISDRNRPDLIVFERKRLQLDGLVVDAQTGQPLAGIRVCVSPDTAPRENFPATTTGPDGAWRLVAHGFPGVGDRIPHWSVIAHDEEGAYQPARRELHPTTEPQDQNHPEVIVFTETNIRLALEPCQDHEPGRSPR